MTRLFAYGTLMCEDIMQEVSSCLPEHRRGVPKGHARQRVKGQPIPAGSKVKRIVWMGLYI